MPLDRHAQRLLAMLAASSKGVPAQDLMAHRAALHDLARMAADPPPPGIVTIEMAFEGPGGVLALRRFTPPRTTGAALLYLHGGGWTAGSLETHAGVCGALAAASGCEVFALDYRLAPEHPFPAAIEDACAALAWLVETAKALRLDPHRIGVAGDSAGANIAAAATLESVRRGARRPALQLLICPILDPSRTDGSRAALRDGWFIEAESLASDLARYCAGVSLQDARIAPLLASDLSQTPATQVHAAEFDPFRDEALAYVERLTAAGVEASGRLHTGLIHYFYALPRAIPAARAALAEIGAEAGAKLAG